MSKLIKGIVGGVLTAIGLGTGLFFLVGIGLSLVGSALRPTPKGGTRDASAATLQVGEYPRTAVFGRAAVAGSLVDAFNYGGTYGTDWELQVIALADHRCDALEGFWVNDTYVAFTADGDVAGYNSQLKVWWRSGTETQALPSVVITSLPAAGWTTDDNGAGVCYVVVAYKADAADSKTPIWTGGRPRFLWQLRGALCYDARLDGTVTGGAGSQRRADPTTWTWSENPIVCRYAWARGIYACDRVGQPAQLLIGRGLSDIEAPPANVAWRANLCDEMVSGAKRYRIGGMVSAADTFINVEENFAAACAGTIIQPEGAVEIDPGASRGVVATFTDADLLVGSKVRWQSFLGQADADWVNTVVPGYIEPAQKWGQHAAPVLRDVADLTADGGPRELSLALAMVTNGAQASRVGEIARRMGRLPGRGQVTLPPRFSGIEEGDWISWQSDRYFGGATKVLRVDAWGSDQGWRHQLTLREIAASVFTDVAAAADGAVAVQQAVPGALAAPGAGAWALSAGYLDSGGIEIPALIIAGASDSPVARLVRIEYVQGAALPSAITQWVDGGLFAPDITRREIPAAPRGSYYASVSYVVDGVQGPRRVLGPISLGTAGQATDQSAAPPLQLAEGALWLAPDGHPYRFGRRELTTNFNLWTFRGETWLTSGYSDAQDSAALVVVIPPGDAVIYCDQGGMPKPGQLPKVLTPVVKRGEADIRTDASVSYMISAPAQVAATVNTAIGGADKGRITIGAGWTGPGVVQLTVTVAGTPYGPFPITVSRQNDQPAAPSGSGGGSGPAYDSTFDPVTSVVFTPISDALGPLTLTSGQALVVTAPLDYEVSAAGEVFRRMFGRLRYSSDGGAAWTTFAAGLVNGSAAHFDPGGFVSDPGSIMINQSQTGLAAGSYLVRLEAAQNAASPAATINVSSGTMTFSVQ